MAHPLIVPSKDVQIYFTTNNLPSIKIVTATALNVTSTKTLQPIYAIGTAEPLSIEDVNAQYNITLTLQTGDIEQILDAVNGALPAGVEPYADLSQLDEFSISVSNYMRNATVPYTVTKTLVQCKADSVSTDYNRNDPETLTTISAQGIGINRIVSPAA